jgi:hypothetical protein
LPKHWIGIPEKTALDWARTGATSSQFADLFLNHCQILIYSDGLGHNKKSPDQNRHFALDITQKDQLNRAAP